MPQHDFIKSVKERKPVERDVPEEDVDPMDSREVADKILEQPNRIEIVLLDGEKLSMRTDFTLLDFVKKRMEMKLMALEGVITAINNKHKSMDQSTLAAIIMGNEDVQELTLDVAAKLCDVERSRFDDNISGLHVANITSQILQIIQKQAAKMQAENGGKQPKKAGRASRKG